MQILPSQLTQVAVSAVWSNRSSRQRHTELRGFGSHLIERLFLFLRLRLPFGRSVIRINIIRIMLSKSQHEMHVTLSDSVHGISRPRAVARYQERAKHEEKRYPAH